jgi:XTP/dITP diphosphohydrolase
VSSCTWVLASGNLGKAKEFERALSGHGIHLVSQASLGVCATDEPHGTFVENALRKARHAAAHTGRPSLADDSGLVVPALGGAPGVHSARFFASDVVRTDARAAAAALSGLPTDEANWRWLLHRMQGLEGAAREARFVCVLVALRSADDPWPLVALGQWPGQILQSASGTQGFGYDPIFFDPQLGRSAASLSLEEKVHVSHRGRALGQLIAMLSDAAGSSAA